MLSLNGKWKLYFGPQQESVQNMEEAKRKFKCIDATVPGDTYLDLLEAGIIEDPFFGRNYLNLRKYEFYRWWYEKDFILPKEFFDKNCELIFHGIDTVATIWLNNKLVGKTHNMFVKHSFDVTNLLKEKQYHYSKNRLSNTLGEGKKFRSNRALLGRKRRSSLAKKSTAFFWGGI
jgi:beta-mannosidase